jgi:3-methyladenine DNA glycosylase AlkD
MIDEKVREIKKELRLAMNGVVSSIQRNHGLNYKINFGVEIPRLKGIAAKFDKDEELAMRLWQDNIRECKLLAIFLLPEEAYPSIAEKWIEEAPFTEIADHLTMVVLSRLPDAATKAIEWIQKSEGMFRYCGYMTLTHLFRRGAELDKEQEERYLTEARRIEEVEERKTVIMAAYNSLGHYSDSEE